MCATRRQPIAEHRPGVCGVAGKAKAEARTGDPSIAEQINRRIAKTSRINPARVYTPFDFLDLGSPHSVGMALMRQVRGGTLRRLARGLYAVPRRHPLLGELQPTADEIAQALARRDGTSVQPAEAMAANLLKLSEQVPARAVYETDGPSRTVKVGALTVQLKNRPPRQVRSVSPMSHLVFAALPRGGQVLGLAQVKDDATSNQLDGSQVRHVLPRGALAGCKSPQ